MDFGVIFFCFALFPVGIFLYSLHNLRRSLNDPKARSHAAITTPIVLVLGPLVITVFMALEASVDPDFMSRSFTNPEGKNAFDLFMFALDQTLKGILFDVMEIFHLSVAELEHKCDSLLFCSALLLYRLSMGTVISIFLLTVIMRLQAWYNRLFGKPDKGAAPSQE